MKEFFARLKAGSSITVNGKTFRGNDVSIVNGRVIVDGVEQDAPGNGYSSMRLSIKIEGNVELLETASGDVQVSGNVGQVNSSSGDVTCADVSGNVQTVSGDVRASRILGSVKSVSGDIRQ